MRSGSAGNGVAGPVGTLRPGPPGRLLLAVTGALVAGSAACLATFQPTGTQALYTSQAPVQHNSIVVGDWTPDPPAGCSGNYAEIVYGTMADDVLYGGNHSQIIMGLGGNDTIYGGNSGDCLVGGDGNDLLVGGNAKDILFGGPGNDHLDGDNAKDHLDGQAGIDVCDGGNGKDTVVNCERSSAAAPPGKPTKPGRASVEPAQADLMQSRNAPPAASGTATTPGPVSSPAGADPLETRLLATDTAEPGSEGGLVHAGPAADHMSSVERPS
jgi:Ca2+-binding RTX toxin-like protein